MLIILFLLCIATYRIFRLKERYHLLLTLSFLFLFWIVILYYFQSEIYKAGRLSGTYGSDEELYYRLSIEILEGKLSLKDILSLTNSPFYLIWEYVILKTSLSTSVLWFKISNLLCLFNTLIVVYLLLRYLEWSHKSSLISIILIGICGGIIYCGIRNIKDILLTFLILEGIFSIKLIFTSHKKFILLLKVFLIALICNFIRPFSTILILSIFIIEWIIYDKNNIRIIIFWGLPLIIIFFYLISIHKKNYIFYLLEALENPNRLPTEFKSSSPNTILRLSTGILRMLVLPVPFKEIYVTFSGDLVIDTGYFYIGIITRFLSIWSSILWWLILPAFLIEFKNIIKNTKYWGLLIYMISHLLIYGIFYFGTVDYRQKIPMYIVGIILAVKCFNSKKFYIYGLLGFSLCILGLLYSYIFND